MALSGLCFTTGNNEGTEVQGKCYKMQPQFDKDKLCQTDSLHWGDNCFSRQGK